MRTWEWCCCLIPILTRARASGGSTDGRTDALFGRRAKFLDERRLQVQDLLDQKKTCAAFQLYLHLSLLQVVSPWLQLP